MPDRTDIISDWIAAIIAYLPTQVGFEDCEYHDVPRPIDGESPVSRRDGKTVVAIWHPEYGQVDRDIALAQPTLIARIFPPKSKMPKVNPGIQLRLAASDFMIAMKAKRKGGDFVPDLACHVSRCTYNYSSNSWYVEARIVSVALNLAASGA